MPSDSISFPVHIGFLLAALLAAFFFLHLELARADEAMIPENTINIAFDLEQRSMTGTSRIALPPDTPLTLHCGHLDISGAMLERAGQTPLALQPSADNTITVPADGVAQTVYVSWSLVVPQHGVGDNLISAAGITLAGLWHPLPDRDMTYRLEAKLPDGFTAVSEGETLVYCKDGSDNRYLTATFDHPLRSIHFVAGPYTVKYREMDNGVTLAAFFFEEDLELADDYLDKTAAYITRYEKLLGPYPYSRYSIVENRLPTGYGMPTFTLLGQAVVRLPFIKDTSLGHEVLHSWFGNSVHLSDSGGNWVEGLTTYLADHLYAEDAGEGADYRKNQLIRYASYVHGDNAMPLEQFANASDSQPMARQVRAIGYDKAAMIFHMLRLRLGDELFFQGLRQFYLAKRYGRAGWEDLEQSFSAVSDDDLSLFFEQWLTRPDIPELTPHPTIDVSQIEGRSVITFTLLQQTAEPYELDIPVLVRTRTGESTHTVRISGKSDEVKLTVDDIPAAMTIDPDYDVMRVLRLEETPPTWSRFMGAPDKTVVLPAAGQSDIYAPLLPILEEMGCELVTIDELDSAEFEAGSFLFLGPSPKSLGLFADPGHAGNGFTLDIRRNPFAPRQVMVLVTSSAAGQTASAAGKLRHYGKYGYLHFVDGRIREQKAAETVQGIQVELFPDPEGVRVTDIRSFDDILSELRHSRVVYIGEMHTDMGTHIAQLQVIQALFQDNPNLAVGMEMFPRSVQDALDGYINGTIATEKEFLKQSDYFTVWGYDYRLYREIIEYARRNRIPLVGLNIDKAIVSHVFKEGSPDGLEAEQLAEVPAERQLDIPGYRERLSQAFSSHDQSNPNGSNLGGFLQAQSIWDEAMAETIVDYLRANPERRMVVIAGNGHIYKDTAIPPRVARRLDVPQAVLSSISHNVTGRETGYHVDYLLYTRSIELPPPAKVGVVLEVEKVDETSDRTRVRVIQISPHGKAGEAGIEKNDIILTVDGHPVEDINDLKIVLMDKIPGDTAKIRLLRSQVLLPDKELELEVELTDPTNSGGKPPNHP